MKRYDIQVGDIRIRATEEGSGEPIYFLHGWGATRRFWRETIPAFSDRYRCVAFDWPGFGSSEKPTAPYTIEWFSYILEQVMRERAVIVAHSMGGTIGATFALENRDRVKKLILVNPVVQGPTAFSWIKKATAWPGVRQATWGLAHVTWIRRTVARPFSYAARLDNELIDDFLRSTYQSNSRSFDSMRRTDLASRLPELRDLLYAIYTDRDRILLPSQWEVLKAALPADQIRVIPDTGHCPMLESPDEFHRILEVFLERAE